MRWIVGSSLKFRRFIVAIAAGLLFLGIVQLRRAPVDALPEFKPPQVELQTEVLGLSAEEVEQLVTVPLEQDLLAGVAFLDHMESASLPGLSDIVMTFEPGTSLLDARQVVSERLTQVAGLPSVGKPPEMIQPTSSTSRAAIIQLSSTKLTPIQLSVLGRWVITPRLLGVPGVAHVDIWGQRDRQLQVLVDPKRLREKGVSIDQIVRSTGNSLDVSPLSFIEAANPGTGGFIDTLNQRLQVFHEQSITNARELGEVSVENAEGTTTNPSGKQLRLSDVATVVENHQPLIGDALCSGGGSCLLMVIQKFPGSNSVEVARGVNEAFDAMRPGLGGVRIDTSIYRPATYVENSFGHLGRNLLIGGILMLLLLALLFFNWRTTLITGVVVLVSVAAAGLVLYFAGTTFNTMVVAGLVMALVVIVDDAVIEVANIQSRVRRHRAGGDGAPAWRIVLDAALEMRRPIIFAGLIAVVATVPVFFTKDVAGAFLPPLATSFLLAVAVSMVVALTLTPALGLVLLPSDRVEQPEPAAM
ncbi:MAG TPA: efflux RND transporter permease subunit, partial [Actinomycetota bacterium]